MIYRDKIRIQLWFGQLDDVGMTCDQMLDKFPDDCWVVLVYSLLLAGNSPEQGEKYIRDWVQRNPSFLSYLDLAYFFQVTHSPDQAAESMLQAAEFQAGDSLHHSHNSSSVSSRAFSAALAAYQSGHLDVAIRLCEHLAEMKEGVDDLGDFALLQKKAIDAQHGNRESLPNEWLRNAFAPLNQMEIEQLLGALGNHDKRNINNDEQY